MEWLEQVRQRVGIDAGTCVLDRQRDAPVGPLVAGDLDEALLRKLERVGGQVQEHAGESDGVPHPAVGVGRDDTHGEALLFGEGPHDGAHRIEQLGQRERRRLAIRQLAAAPRQLDRIAHDRAQSQRGAVDQPQLAVLYVVHRAALRALERFGQEQDGGER